MKTFISCFLILINLSAFAQEKQFQKARKKNSIEAYQKFIKKFPVSKFTDDAEFHKAEVENTSSAFETYIKKYPNGGFTNEAKKCLCKLEFEKIENSNEIEQFKLYLERFPDCNPYSITARGSLIKLEFEKVEAINLMSSYKTYFDNYPDCPLEFYNQALNTLNINNKDYVQLTSDEKDVLCRIEYLKSERMNNMKIYEDYLLKFPNCMDYSKKVTEKIVVLIRTEFEQALATNTIAALSDFIMQYQNCKYPVKEILDEADMAKQKLTFYCTIESIYTGIIEIRDDLSIKYNDGYKEYKQSFKSIKELNIEWDYEIRKEYLNPMWMSTTVNGKTEESFSYDEVKEIYGFRIKSVSVKTFDNQTTKLTNIKSIYPNRLVFNTNVEDKHITISLILREFEKNSDSFSTQEDIDRFFMSKPIKLDKTSWEAPISTIRFN